jgi:hypothetical protein
MSLKNQTDDQLVEGIGHWGGRPEPLELIRRLKDSVEKLNETSTKQQEEMIRLTRWICGLTVVMVIVGIIQVVQIVVSFNKPH